MPRTHSARGRVGELMFPIAQKFVSQSLLVSDDQIIEAQRTLWQQLRLIAEPGGATAFAALLSGVYKPHPGERVGVVLCGSNADLEKFPHTLDPRFTADHADKPLQHAKQAILAYHVSSMVTVLEFLACL